MPLLNPISHAVNSRNDQGGRSNASRFSASNRAGFLPPDARPGALFGNDMNFDSFTSGEALALKTPVFV